MAEQGVADLLSRLEHRQLRAYRIHFDILMGGLSPPDSVGSKKYN
jgi:hypothetical protein